MASSVFISYRRDDSAAWAGRLYERLTRDFRRTKIFLDVDQIAPGANYVQVLEEQVNGSDVVLALIGKSWIDARDPDGQRRLDNPGDFVRIEIESALRQGIHVIPVLVDGAVMPTADQLPAALAELVKRNAVTLTHRNFSDEAKSLVGALKAVPKRKVVKPAAGATELGLGSLVDDLAQSIGRSVLYTVVFLFIPGIALISTGLIGPKAPPADWRLISWLVVCGVSCLLWPLFAKWEKSFLPILSLFFCSFCWWAGFITSDGGGFPQALAAQETIPATVCGAVYFGGLYLWRKSRVWWVPFLSAVRSW